MNIVARIRTWPRSRMIVVSAVVVAAVVVGGVLIALSLSPEGSEADTPPTSTKSAEPTPAQPDTAYVSASFAGWTPDENAGQFYSAEVGAADDGGISLRVDREPTDGSSAASLRQTVVVTPSTSYTFRARVSAADLDATSSGVAFQMGSDSPEQFDFPAAPAGWTDVTWTYDTDEGESELPLALVAQSTGSGYRIDSLTLNEGESADDLLVNGSFEEYSAPTQITNKSLIMKTSIAGIGLAWRTPSVVWNVTDETGTVVANGDLPIANGLALLGLKELPQGYYSANLVSSDGAIAAQQISFMVLDDPSAPSSTDSRFGVGIHLGPQNDGSEKAAAAIGFTEARTDAYWALSENIPGEYSFPENDDANIQSFAEVGLAMLPISAYGNPLYDGGSTPSSGLAIGAYSDYTSAVVEHYSPGAVEIYNEFNWLLNDGACGKTADCYMQLLQPTADKIRAEHPGTTIVGPSTAHLDDAFMTELYQAGGLNYLDAVSFHPYDELNVGAEILLPILKQANERIKEYSNGQAKPIWLTEMGWTSGKVGELNQANYLVRGQTISFANGVERFYWYDLVNDNLDLTDGEGNFGLLRQFNDAVPAFAPKPAAMAQAMLARKIADKPFAAEDVLDGSTFSYVFGEGASATRVAWATSPTTVTYATTKPVTVTSQFGKISTLTPTDGQVSIELTEQAVYLDGALTGAAIAAP